MCVCWNITVNDQFAYQSNTLKVLSLYLIWIVKQNCADLLEINRDPCVSVVYLMRHSIRQIGPLISCSAHSSPPHCEHWQLGEPDTLPVRVSAGITWTLGYFGPRSRHGGWSRCHAVVHQKWTRVDWNEGRILEIPKSKPKVWPTKTWHTQKTRSRRNTR